VIYVDTSVVLAQLMAEDRCPPASLWGESLVASRLLEHEAWTRIHGRGLGRSHGDALRQILARLAFLEMTPPVLGRALEPFPLPVRTLDALHLAFLEFLRGQGQDVALASYDERLLAAGRRLGVRIARV